MKKNIFIGALAILFVCTLQNAMAVETRKPVIANVWPEAVTFSKQQMSRQDSTDPSYEYRLENILLPSKSGLFSGWNQKINDLYN